MNVTIESLLDINPSTPGDESQIFTSGLSHHPDAEVGAESIDPADPVSPSMTPIPSKSLQPANAHPSTRSQNYGTNHENMDGGEGEGEGENKIKSWTWLERRKTAYRVVSRVGTTAICVGTAIALPGFGKVMAFLGSFSAFLICIILPVSTHPPPFPYLSLPFPSLFPLLSHSILAMFPSTRYIFRHRKGEDGEITRSWLTGHSYYSISASPRAYSLLPNHPQTLFTGSYWE